MQDEYFHRLAPDVQLLVNDIEQAAGLEVDVRVDPLRAGRGPDAAGILACDIDEYHACILIPAPEKFPDGAVVHELLHIRRLLVQGVPQIIPEFEYAAQSEAIADLDNALEHLVIVPEEIAYRPERVNHWNGIMKETWCEKLPAIRERADQFRWAKMQWAFLQHVLPGNEVVPIAQQLLEELGLVDDAQCFHEALIPTLVFKERSVRLCFHHLGLPLQMASLEYLDSRTHSSREMRLIDFGDA